MLQHLMSIDANTLLWIQENIRNDILTPLFVTITTLGNGGFIWIAVGVLLLIPKRTRKVGLMTLTALALSWLIDNALLKNLIARTRPYEVVSGLTSIIGPQHDFSFPSGHTGSSFAAALVMFMCLPKSLGIPSMVLAFLIGLSRLYVGVHYPSDVLGGALIGTAIALVTYYFFKRLNKDKIKA